MAAGHEGDGGVAVALPRVGAAVEDDHVRADRGAAGARQAQVARLPSQVDALGLGGGAVLGQFAVGVDGQRPSAVGAGVGLVDRPDLV
ncbi:MAG TPA: hypothetical protein VGV40_12380 [Solirubrobacteraceae bacterium]|nr:hypothetical protein [Solirubrobacteraceae bacterium]